MKRAALIAPLILGLLMPLIAAAETIVSGLSQSSVSITTDYAGTEILIYGAVRREAPILKEPPLRVIITVEGPDLPVVIRRKERTFGIWLNDARLCPGPVPTFYAVATSAPLKDALAPEEDLRLGITLPPAMRSPDSAAQPFLDALLRLRTQSGFYALNEGSIGFTEDTLFNTVVRLPAALTEGNYKVRIFLTREGEVVDEMRRTIWVRKTGLERFLHNAAHEYALLYGFAALLIAGLAGWGASAIFARLRW